MKKSQLVSDCPQTSNKLTAGRDIAPSQSHPTFCTDEIQPLKVITLAKRMLLAIRTVDGKEFGCNDVPTVLEKMLSLNEYIRRETTNQALETIQMKNRSQSPYKRTLHCLPT